MEAQFALYTAAGGTLIADYSYRVRGLTFATNNRGFAECTAFVPMSLPEAFLLYDRPGLPHVTVTDDATGSAFEGRLEDVEIVDGGVQLTALGYARALSDVPYTAFWTATDTDLWNPMTEIDISNRKPKLYTMDTQNRIFIGLNKNAVYANATDVGSMRYTVPDDSSRNIAGIEMIFTHLLPNNWLFRVFSWTAGFGAATLLYSNTSTGALFSGVVRTTVAAAPIIEISIFNNTGAPYTYTGESGANYLQITSLHWVSSTTSQINTTLTVARAAGVNVTATVGTTAGMYVGQTLYVGGTEAVVVLSIGSPTQFNATFVNNQVLGAAVVAFVIYADDIAEHLISQTNFYNSTQLSSSTVLVQSPANDLLNEIYEDQYPADVLDYLTGLGDSSSRVWEWGVYEDQRLYFRPRASAGRTWYIDVSSLDIARTLDSMHNNVYAVYDVNGTTVRSPTNSNTTSVSRYNLFRQLALQVNTNSSVQAGVQRDAALADSANPIPRSQIEIEQVYDAFGSRWPLSYVRAGDTIIIRNLPPTLSTSLDRIRVFIVSRTSYDADADTLTIEPELPRARLDALLAQLASGVGATLGIGLNIPKSANTSPPKGGKTRKT